MTFIEQILLADRAGLREPWKPCNGSDAAEKKVHCVMDPPDQVQRCLRCPYPECKYQDRCSYRLNGVARLRKAPKGYDRVKIAKVLALQKVCTAADLAPILGVSITQARVCLMHYYEERENGNGESSHAEHPPGVVREDCPPEENH